jgi:hypothetical protein
MPNTIVTRLVLRRPLYRLHMSGIDVLRALRTETLLPPFVMVSAWLTTSITVEAMKLGAVDVLEKPLEFERLLASVEAAVERAHSAGTAPQRAASDRPPTSVAGRWGWYVLKGCDAASDPSTLELWARESAVSYTTLCEICRLNGIRPIDARDFVRVLRALRAASGSRVAPDIFLAVGDRRTLRSLSLRSGVNLEAKVRTNAVTEFFKAQQFIAPDSGALRSISKVLMDETDANV